MLSGHARHTQRAIDATHIEDVGLHDVDHPTLADQPPGRKLAILLAAGHRHGKRIRHLLGLFQFPVRTGLLEVLDTLGFEQASHLDRAGWRKAAIGIDEQRHPGAERPTDRRDDLLGPPRPLVDVVATLGADAKLEGVEAKLIPQPGEPGCLVARGDVALHGRGVGSELPRRAAEQRHDGLAFELATEVPERRIEAAHRALQIGARKLVLLFLDPVEQGSDGEGVRAESPRRHLSVEDLRRDVRVIGGQLAPPLGPVLGRDAHEADVAVREGLEAM